MRPPSTTDGLESSQPIFIAEAKKINSQLSKLSEAELASWMKLSPSLAKQTFRDILQFSKKHTPHGAAILSYAGDVYKGLKAETFSKAELQFAQDHVAILSGLYGILRPLDAIYPYRLEMGISIKVGSASSLYKFWGDKPASVVKKRAEGDIINLASEEYYSAVAPFLDDHHVIHIHFREKVNGKLQLKSAFAKKARGLFCRFAIENKITDSAKLKHFNVESYTYEPSVSDKNNWYFVR